MVQETKTGNRRAKRLVLVVEDNDLNRDMLCMFLSEDYEVLEAANGKEGFELLQEHHADLSLVLLDMYMPVCNGLEFLQLRSEDEQLMMVPVIVATASAAAEDEIRCLELGANDFVNKPYNFDIILNRAHNIISLRENASIVNQLTWDEVTNLYRKEFFNREVKNCFDASPDQSFDLLCSDVENYSMLVDRYGEQNCNLMLKGLADYFCDTLPGFVIGGRIGTDMFAFLIEHQQPGWETALASAKETVTFPNVTIKFGLVEAADHEMPAPQICNRAMRAIDTIKGQHGAYFALFDDKLHQQQILEQLIRDTMEEALRETQFSVHFQPKHDVRTGRVGGAEALVRWMHPEIGFISPGLFIPIFERSGFITKLDMFVWEEACKQITRCRELGLPEVPISVNASRLDFDVPNLPELISGLTDKYGIDRSLLHVELTETAYSENPEAVVDTLERLKELGFSTELDDFGSGYSSLVSLNTLPLDIMKLDMSMIRQAAELNDFRIIESTIRLAQVLGLKTVVEGVETAEEAEKVKEIGCDLIQGYYYSKPLNHEDFEEYLSRDGVGK